MIQETSRTTYRDAMHRLADDSTEAIILGCTEISLLIDTTELRARAAALHALN